MAAHLEAHPDARAVVNFAPVLLEQIETYLYHIERWRHGGQTIGDPLLAALVDPALPEPGSPAFLDLMEKCLRANAERIIKRFPAYARLAEVADLYRTRPDIQRYLSTQFLADLLVWYHLGWMAETVRRKHGVVQSLQEKAHQYTLDDRKALLDVIAELMASIGPRYRHLAHTGQVELAMSPWAHPIVPLLLDFSAAREAMPDIALPEHDHYPGGKERAIWHLAEFNEHQPPIVEAGGIVAYDDLTASGELCEAARIRTRRSLSCALSDAISSSKLSITKGRRSALPFGSNPVARVCSTSVMRFSSAWPPAADALAVATVARGELPSELRMPNA